MVKRCLSEQLSLEYFGDICKEDKQGRPWVTVFKEKKKSDEHFKPVDDNTVIIFCELEEPDFKDKAYLGHLLIQRTTDFLSLSVRVANEMAELPERQECDFYLDGEKLTQVKMQSSLIQV